MEGIRDLEIANLNLCFGNKEANGKTKHRKKNRHEYVNKASRDNELFYLLRKCACVNASQFVPVCNSTYRMEQNKT